MLRIKVLALIAFSLYQVVNFFYFQSHTVFPDEQRFLDEAKNFANYGEFWTGKYRAWEMPLTGIIYSVFYKAPLSEGGIVLSIRVFNSALLIFQAFIFYRLAYFMFNSKEVALVAYSLYLFYPFFVFYQALVLSETIFITFFLLGFYFLYRWRLNHFLIDWQMFSSLLFFVLALYTKGVLTILPVVLVVLFYVLNNKINFKSLLSTVALSIASYSILMSPWWVRNYSLFDEFVPFTTSGYHNLYLGANKHNQDGGIDWSKDVDVGFVNRVHQIDNEIEVSRIYKTEALKYIVENPYAYLRLSILKLQRFYNPVFNSDQFDKPHYNIISITTYGIYITLSLVAFVQTSAYWRLLSPIYMTVFYFTIMHMLFISSIRYRLPIEPFFILMASYSLSSIKSTIFKKLN